MRYKLSVETGFFSPYPGSMAKQYDTKFQKALGERIAFFRKKAALSQEKLAAETNLHRTYIGFIEQGKRDPSIGSLQKIANALRVPLSEIFSFPTLQIGEEKTEYKTKPKAK